MSDTPDIEATAPQRIVDTETGHITYKPASTDIEAIAREAAERWKIGGLELTDVIAAAIRRALREAASTAPPPATPLPTTTP